MRHYFEANWGWARPVLGSFCGLPIARTLWDTYSQAALTAPRVLSSWEEFRTRVWCARRACLLHAPSPRWTG